MAVGHWWSKGINPVTVPSGDYIDTAEEDGLRVAGKIPMVSMSTAIKAIDGGTGTIGDGVSATGSTAAVTFTAAFTAAPVVVATTVPAGLDVAVATSAGSYYDIALAGRGTGSAVFFGASGVPFHWVAYGSRY